MPWHLDDLTEPEWESVDHYMAELRRAVQEMRQRRNH